MCIDGRGWEALVFIKRNQNVRRIVDGGARKWTSKLPPMSRLLQSRFVVLLIRCPVYVVFEPIVSSCKRRTTCERYIRLEVVAIRRINCIRSRDKDETTISVVIILYICIILVFLTGTRLH